MHVVNLARQETARIVDDAGKPILEVYCAEGGEETTLWVQVLGPCALFFGPMQVVGKSERSPLPPELRR